MPVHCCISAPAQGSSDVWRMNDPTTQATVQPPAPPLPRSLQAHVPMKSRGPWPAAAPRFPKAVQTALPGLCSFLLPFFLCALTFPSSPPAHCISALTPVPSELLRGPRCTTASAGQPPLSQDCHTEHPATAQQRPPFFTFIPAGGHWPRLLLQDPEKWVVWPTAYFCASISPPSGAPLTPPQPLTTMP